MSVTNFKKRYLWSILALFFMVNSPDLAATTKKKSDRDAPSQEEYYSTSDRDISQEDRQKANNLRLQTIASIKGLIGQKNVKGSRRFELLLRMGELYSESHDYIRDQELQDYETKYSSWEKNDKKGPTPKLNEKKSKEQLANAASAYRKLVNEFPKSPRTAAALFALGKTLSRLGDDGSVLYFQRLAKDFKTSPLLPDTYLALGDFYFEKQQIDKSIDAYKKYLKFKEHPGYPYGVYKLGWAFYDASAANSSEAKDNIEKSINSFKLAIKLSEKKLPGRNYRIDLKTEALNDLVMVWSETEDTEAAWAYFKSIDAKDSFYSLLEKLGDIYARQGRTAQATNVFQRLVTEAPTRPNAYRIHEKLLQLFETSGKPNQLVSTLSDMQTAYVSESKWTKTNAKDTTLVAEAKTLTEFSMHRYGTLYHNRGQKTKNRDQLAAAAQIYNMHLTAFPNSKNAYEIRYYYADLMLDFGKYETAAAEYLKVADANPKGKYLKDASLNAVVALNKLDQQTKYDKIPPAGQVPKPITLPKSKQQLVHALDHFVAVLPKDKSGDPMRFTAAQTYFEYGHYDEAAKRFEKIVHDIPQTKQANASLKIILAYHADKKEWDKTIELSRKYLANKSITSDLRNFIVTVMRNSMYGQAQDLESNQQFEAAGRAFLAFQKEFSWDKSAGDKALRSAANNFYKAGLLEDALAANTKLIDQYPQSEQAPNATLDIGQTFEALGQYDKAGDFYRRFATNFPKNELAPRALYNAAALANGINQYSEAESLYTRMVRTYPANNLATDARLELASIQERQSHFKEAASTYHSIYSDPGKMGADDVLFAGAKAGVLFAKVGLEKDAIRIISSVRARLKGNQAPAAPVARSLIAEHLFAQTDAATDAFKKQAITNPNNLVSDVRRKQASLVQLASQLETVIQIESPEYTVASLYRLGELHENFANSLLAIQSPQPNNEVETSKFHSSIEKLAFPLRDEAAKFFDTAYKRSLEVETLTTWTQKAYDKVAELSPDKHPEVLERSQEPTFIANKIRLESAVSALAH